MFSFAFFFLNLVVPEGQFFQGKVFQGAWTDLKFIQGIPEVGILGLFGVQGLWISAVRV